MIERLFLPQSSHVQRVEMSADSDKPKPDELARFSDRSSPQLDASDFDLPPSLEFIRVLGHGSMATVILVRDTALRRLAAVKFLRKELSADAVCRRRFEREAQTAAGLSHESITTIYSVGRSRSDEPYIVMEFIDGNDLADTLSAHESVAILVQIASALAAAHENNIVHRDVKPANVLIESRTKRAKLTDFGLAAILETAAEAITRLTRADERLGDPRYMSPEQLRGETLTGQSDVYGLGIIGYELLTGKGPFDDPEIRNIASAHLRRPPPQLNRIRASVPQAISDTLSRCLAKNPAHRPRAQALPKLLQRQDAMATVDTETGPVAEFLRELQQRKVYRAALAYAAAAFLVLQVADLVLPALTQSNVPYQLIVIACLGGFPVVMALSWIFDLRQGRIVRAASDRASSPARSATPLQRQALKFTGLGISIALASAIALWLLS